MRCLWYKIEGHRRIYASRLLKFGDGKKVNFEDEVRHCLI